MREENITLWTEFVLAGLLHLKSSTVFVGVINSMFAIALIGNSLFLFLIKVDSRLHIPMYFFLSQLSIMDLCQVLAIVPMMTVNFATNSYTISLYGCALQIFVTLAVGGAECLILATMAYDRYVAICKPLQYPVLLRNKICCIMSLCTWFWSCVQALVCSLYVLPLPYCKTNVMVHNFCFEYEVPRKEPQSLGHLFVPFVCGGVLLWSSYFDLHDTHILLFSRKGCY
ncbi:putative olfactory receptor 13C6 [Ahaetulla prasina]|uniref:putative olfactory receptor 13C6 n=1 Tax=Ahaetulla prasina TaxID=499056 RepID=UPI00264842D8|nr:putative olfactory receptor 13C6 [Ahaetulla prasina]